MKVTKTFPIFRISMKINFWNLCVSHIILFYTNFIVALKYSYSYTNNFNRMISYMFIHLALALVTLSYLILSTPAPTDTYCCPPFAA